MPGLERLTDEQLAAELKRREKAAKGGGGIRVREYELPWERAAKVFGFPADDDTDDQADDDTDDDDEDEDEDGKGKRRRRGFFGD